MPIWDIEAEAGGGVKTGLCVPHGGNSPPDGFLECDGAAVSRSTYIELFAAIGTLWGVGDGSTTFNIPDFRGEFLRGWDNGRGIDPGRGIASFQAQDLIAHIHTLSPINLVFEMGFDTKTGYDESPGTLNTGSTGGSETRPRNKVTMICIKW